MRITGGEYCGKTVEVPHGALEIRPAMDRMRESIFGALTSRTEGMMIGISFLDLFSGSGIIGLEAASRGARPVTCVEKDREKFPILLKNVEFAGDAVKCKCQSVELYLDRTRDSHDIIFCDPPFPYRFRSSLLSRVESGMALNEGGLLLLHFPKEDKLPDSVGRLSLEDERVYGRSIVRFYRAL